MFKKKQKQIEYNKENQKPIIRCSICTGEQVAGLKELHTGKFTEIMFIRHEKDLDTFKKMYGLKDVEKEY